MKRFPRWVQLLIYVVVGSGVVVWILTPAQSSSSSAGSGSDDPIRLPFTVTFHLDRIQATNDGSVTWRDCRATILGGYSLELPADIGPGSTATFLFDDMTSGERAIPPNEGFARARKETVIRCDQKNGPSGRGTFQTK